jgi:four helix bundle protein
MSLDDDFARWEATLPIEITGDAVWTCAAYRLATFISDWAWDDLDRLRANPRTVDIADQLGRALRGIGATYTEAYSRRSFKDRCRYYEYSLGSAREARDWTFKGRRVLGDGRTQEMLSLLARIIRLLTTTIVNERARDQQDGKSRSR